MWKWATWTSGVAGAVLAGASPAAAEAVCKDRATFLGYLGDSYAEAPVAAGLARNGNVVEVLSSRDSGTWTIIVTQPSGVSCIVATGEAWQAMPGDGRQPEPRT
jgi:hypothetical protein